MKHTLLLTTLLATLGASACAGLPATPSDKETPVMQPMPTENASEFRVHAPEEFPELTPEEMGRRFLMLIEETKSFDELTLENVERTMGIQLERIPDEDTRSFKIELPESGWRYGIRYHRDVQLPITDNVTYHFHNFTDDRADMEPVCGLDFDAYYAELKRMGFKDEPGQYEKTGMLLALKYSRDQLMVTISVRGEADAPESKRKHACIESISFS